MEAQRSPEDGITYAIRESPSGRIVARISSSYQPDPGELPNWSFNHAARAHAYWDEASDIVAIDEAAHDYEGTVLIIMFRKGRQPKEIQLPEQKLVGLTGGKWERYRFGCDGWLQARQLGLSLVAQPSNPIVRFHISITITRSGAIKIDAAHIIRSS
ncbi:MAG: hypothetical protein M3Y86_07225 [Verrucomicrobiota bacterium]|nr:hypothetical protein [Verrucomicrobiota bacterium]